MLGLSVVAVTVAVTACSDSPGADPVDTVGVITEPTVTTLLPIVVDTESDLTSTVPPEVLFGGDLCSALTEADIANAGVGTVVESAALSPDSCGWTVQSGRVYRDVIVQVRTAREYEQPLVAAGITIDQVRGVGIAAIGYVLPDRSYTVVVQTDNGYFAVTAPDETGAVGLARLAAARADG